MGARRDRRPSRSTRAPSSRRVAVATGGTARTPGRSARGPSAGAGEPLVSALEVRDFRSMRELRLEPGPVCALVGEAQAGKSNLLAALHAVLDPVAAGVRPADVRRGGRDLVVRARLRDGAWVSLAGRPPTLARERPPATPPVVFLAAADRATTVVAAEAAEAEDVRVRRLVEHVREGLGRRDRLGVPVPAPLCVIEALERCVQEHLRGIVLLVEEPELYLRPQAQRYLARLLRTFAEQGNQVLFATQSPAFLNVARMDELVFVERELERGTQAVRVPPVTPDEDFRLLTEFDAERAELFLARAALLVEGETEKVVLPFVFAALGEDADRAGISIVECGGKANMVLFAEVCRAAGVPFAVLYDRDGPPGRRPPASQRIFNEQLVRLAGQAHAVELAPDFESVSRLPRGGHKPERAWRRFAQLPVDRMPGDLVRAARITLALAAQDGAGRLGPAAARRSPPAGHGG